VCVPVPPFRQANENDKQLQQEVLTCPPPPHSLIRAALEERGSTGLVVEDKAAPGAGHVDLVTEVDRRAEEVIMDRLKAALPVCVGGCMRECVCEFTCVGVCAPVCVYTHVCVCVLCGSCLAKAVAAPLIKPHVCMPSHRPTGSWGRSPPSCRASRASQTSRHGS
jgi:hypothetical protein